MVPWLCIFAASVQFLAYVFGAWVSYICAKEMCPVYVLGAFAALLVLVGEVIRLRAESHLPEKDS